MTDAINPTDHYRLPPKSDPGNERQSFLSLLPRVANSLALPQFIHYDCMLARLLSPPKSPNRTIILLPQSSISLHELILRVIYFSTSCSDLGRSLQPRRFQSLVLGSQMGANDKDVAPLSVMCFRTGCREQRVTGREEAFDRAVRRRHRVTRWRSHMMILFRLFVSNH